MLKDKLLFSILLSFSWYSCSQPIQKTENPIAYQGIIDLSSWDFDQNGPVRLDGQWEFHWQKLYTPDDHPKEGFLEKRSMTSPYAYLPVAWNGIKINDKTLSGHGYATYRLIVKLPPSPPSLALRTKRIHLSHQIWIDDELLLKVGRVGTGYLDEIPKFLPKTAIFNVKKNWFKVTLQVSNHQRVFGGVMDSIFLGTQSQIAMLRDKSVFLDIFLFGSLLIMSIYHFGLYLLRRQDPSSILFGLLSLFMAFRGITIQEHLMVYFFDWNYELNRLIHILTNYVTPFLGLLYIQVLFPLETSKKFVKAAGIFELFFCLYILFTPARMYDRGAHLFEAAALIMLFYIIVTVIRALLRKKTGALTIILGLVALLLTVINDLLYANGVVFTGQFISLGLFLFIISQSFLLSARYSRAFSLSEKYSQELAEKNKKLTRLDSLKNEFLANTSHELRTPLYGMIGIAESLLAGAAGELEDFIKKNLSIIVMSGRRLTNLINDILDFSKLRNSDIRLSLHPVDIRALCRIVIEVSHPLAQEKKLTLENDISETVSAVLADENRLQQILYNLIGNAVKFTPFGGRIVLSATKKNDKVEIAVSDTGMGIEPDQQKRIFQSFEQLDTTMEWQYSGTGLGLSISKKLAQLQGSDLKVHSSPGEGSRFFFSLPAVDINCTEQGLTSDAKRAHFLRDPQILLEDASVPDPKTANEQPVGAEKVLIVDDEPVNRQILLNLLQMHHFSIIEASDGISALQKIEKEKPALVLLDIMMPDMNGYEVCRRLRKQYSLAEMPVVILTARNQAEDILTALSCGANDFLSKPFSTAELVARINTLRDLKKHHDQAIALRKRLQLEEKMALIGKTAANLVHDMKNIVSVIHGFSDMVAEEENRNQRFLYLDMIRKGASRIDALTMDILDYTSGNMRVQKKEVNPESFLSELREFMSPVFLNRGVRFSTKNQIDALIMIDPERFARVLINLAGNAADILESGQEFSITLSEKGLGMLFVVSDSGPGIPPVIQSTLFEPFVTVNKNRGTGLGMAIVKSIVEAHDGKIWFETAPNLGTKFFIEIPNELITKE